ncbi:hypothetical protein ABL78_7479 [Leptomonas seymouri]|uniref:Uncharacterized protein n=1 Tax=Leptomonas seymouri TaxID=5684 RepID=A0A0N1IHX1_LEPSE|nr:hypothetical protein ABL78_7479 [Leptomonas seymouri]|eukprot:KPI83484.1 hypothetical protein ABL78_7479 [Leptomonas seymouri]
MFVRIRGKGACPENSQAAVMHIRGFRHTHSSAPPRSFYVLISTSTAVTHREGASSSPTAAAAPPSVEMRPFKFPLFPVGVHAAALTEAQARVMTSEADSKLSALDNEVARMVWKETWNLYDILYDEVPLLPWTEAESGSATATALAETVEGELRLLAESTGKVTLAQLESLKGQTDDFELASGRAGNRQVVVCPHYYSSAALPEGTFSEIQTETHPTTVSAHGPVMVIDLKDLSVSVAGGKAMVNIAWYTAFAAMQPDSALLRCRAVVVRLPYGAVPTYANALESSTPASPTMADAFVEAVDFIGEHIAAVRHAMVRELGSKSAGLAQACAPAPPVLVVGSAPEAMGACLHALMASSSSSSSPAGVTAPSDVVVFYGDHLIRGAEDGDIQVHELGARKGAEYKSIAEACACALTVETVLVPLKALLEGGEEPWDPYTLRERQRLNFCPCCGSCGHEAGDGEADLDHSHGHGHGSHHEAGM